MSEDRFNRRRDIQEDGAGEPRGAYGGEYQKESPLRSVDAAHRLLLRSARAFDGRSSHAPVTTSTIRAASAWAVCSPAG
jgi:hypothetical protein